MVYDLSADFDRQRFKRRVNHLYKSARLVEVVDISNRTRSQYNYCHLAIAFFAAETGENFDKVKQVYFKRECNPDIFIRKVWDKVLNREIDEVLSINDVKDIEQMSRCIDAWIKWCADRGVEIPPADDDKAIRYATSVVSMNEKFLRMK